ncbi:RnfABCDGE type electron transport complex subunit B [Buchnera aphidicola (Acyrthosiphon lactucae)]|uniref:Ion-translocating oxidoreductase complex subunit B n=1 Tax=Buchnera aphidicola (Acyrthosiphon lactucae) TaxID=1241832 RepID=A0A4D6XRI1_9GAMM|nr:RnfABCDGE type electron transport complex subunit B [Buchnera aphidicola]QCI17524.1 RnfABCDGE type electron transport complex subunit B [Buchnera aphidicola (Acyrthosiphon lactucae)]
MIIFIFFGVLSFLLGVILSFTAYKFQFKKDPTIQIVNKLLPQSQCAQCGYSGCYPYAKAIVKNSEEIDKCIPGGFDLALEIANVLNIKVSKKNIIINNKKQKRMTVWIEEKNCVGCSKCATFCPVDAIVGAPNFIHTVLEKFCTGCNICLLHCPTNCIKIKKETHE